MELVGGSFMVGLVGYRIIVGISCFFTDELYSTDELLMLVMLSN